MGNITELCDGEELTFKRELKSGTFQGKKEHDTLAKYKTDGFLVSNLEAEEDDELIANMDLKSTIGRGGSHKYNIYSENKETEGDFDLNKISEVDPINEDSRRDSSLKDLKFSDEDSNSSEEEDRRRPIEIDFNF